MFQDNRSFGVDSASKIMLHLDDRLWLLTVSLCGNAKGDAERLLEEGSIPCGRLRMEIMDLFDDGTALAWRSPEGRSEQGKMCQVYVNGKEREAMHDLLRRGITPVVVVSVQVLGRASESAFTISVESSPVEAGEVMTVLAYDV